MLRDYFTLALRALTGRRLRSWLTMLGIFIGIAAIVSLIALGNGLRAAIINQVNFIGADMIVVSPGGLAGPPGSESGSTRLFESDYRAVDRLDETGLTASFLTRTLRVGYGDEETSALVFGLPTDEQSRLFDELSAFDVAEGRKLRNGDNRKVILGYGFAAATVFSEEIPLGKTIEIQGISFEVIGIRDKVGNPILDNQVIVTLDGLRSLTGIKEEISGIRARPKAGVSVEDTQAAVAKALRNHRDVDEGEEDFQITTSQQFLETLGTILLMVQAVVIGIAGISLLVGGIGIMNTMYTSVLERTRQIGIMKAIGARNSDVLFVFLFESGLLGLVGGGIGVIIGILLAQAVEFGGSLAFGSGLIQAEISLSLIVGALAFSFVIGTIAGVLPARTASKANPVEALRYE